MAARQVLECSPRFPSAGRVRSVAPLIEDQSRLILSAVFVSQPPQCTTWLSSTTISAYLLTSVLGANTKQVTEALPECACLYIGQSPYSSASAMSFPPDATCLIGLNLHDIHVLHPPRSTRTVDCRVDSYLTSSLAASFWPFTSLADCADLRP